MKNKFSICFLISFVFCIAGVNAEENSSSTPAEKPKKEVYKSVDRFGNVTFTDEPVDNAEKIEVKDLPVLNLPSMQKTYSKPPTKTENKTAYSKFTFVSPKNDQNFWNQPAIKAEVQLTPPLRKNHKLVFLLDGKKVSSKDNSLILESLDRGKHTLTAQIQNAQGKTLKSTQVQFHIHKTSSLNKPARN